MEIKFTDDIVTIRPLTSTYHSIWLTKREAFVLVARITEKWGIAKETVPNKERVKLTSGQMVKTIRQPCPRCGHADWMILKSGTRECPTCGMLASDVNPDDTVQGQRLNRLTEHVEILHAACEAHLEAHDARFKSLEMVLDAYQITERVKTLESDAKKVAKIQQDYVDDAKEIKEQFQSMMALQLEDGKRLEALKNATMSNFRMYEKELHKEEELTKKTFAEYDLLFEEMKKWVRRETKITVKKILGKK